MRILVLRPEPAASRTRDALSALGHEAIRLPLSQAKHDLTATRKALGEPHSAIAVTSAEIARLSGRLGDGLATTVFAVGQASAAAMRAAGFPTVLAAGGDGESLAAMIAAHYRKTGVPDAPLLYLAGNPRAPGFESRLREAGIPFRTVEAYRMTPLTPAKADIEAALLAPLPDAVLLYSRESALAFFRLPPIHETPERFQSVHLLCMSRNVAAAVPRRFAANVSIAAAPDEKSLFALL
jgi:uroporphyrinogen-III synthase